jgi:tetratricopeptide (TPR) repeat protein
MKYLLALFLLVLPPCVLTQMGTMNMSVPPVRLEKGLGPVHHKVTTHSAEAQAFFDQGLSYIYAFNHDEAVRSFQRAAEIDPNMAMAYWGIALARGSNYNWNATSDQLAEAFQNLQKALKNAPNTSPAERAYIAALSKRYSSDPNADQAKLAAAYSAAMKELTKKFPNDLDAATLYAESLMDLHPWQLWTHDGQPAPNTLEIISVLESVLRRNPDHVGANHYYIHAVEASPHPEKGLPSARRLATLAPNAGHLVHMPSHIYIRTGNYFGAAASNTEAIKVDEAYLKRFGGPNFYSSMYTNHNIHFLASTSAMIGRYKESSTRAKELADNVMPMIPGMPMLEFYALYPMVVAVRFHKWGEIKSMPAPDTSFKLVAAYWHFARGMAMARTADAAGATIELNSFHDAVKTVPPDLPIGNNTPADYFGIADALLSGEVELARGNVDNAIASLRKAQTLAAAFNYNEPPDWDLPIAEFLGPALLKNKHYADAAAVYREELKHHPNSGRALFGLAEALKGQKNSVEARKVSAQFTKAWREADTPLRLADLY